MITGRVRDRGDGTKVVTIPKDADIKAGDNVAILRLTEGKIKDVLKTEKS